MTNAWILTLCAVVLATQFSVSASADTDIADTAFGMMEYCMNTNATPRELIRESNSAFKAGVCFGSFATIRYYFDKKAVDGVCIPTKVTLGQVVRVFNAFTQRHPEAQHETYQNIAYVALRQAFPCK